ncbi:hypothetical protein CBER1_10261 [Cercospora berteroae]|uniref:Ecp2 effector protein-like domain-containing protein n=1 Tax=Cercospora berteroae TaxID=357750 RepID=A0A2S6BYH0_9PEZI|nr:hypothetical protein CBER1_10261 [Cercospora berteroae]
MHFSALTAFAALAAASPLAFPQNAGTGGPSTNKCGATTPPAPVTGSGEPPVLDDCNKMRDSAINAKEPWTVSGPQTLADFGTCAFSVSTVSGGTGYVGTDDVKNLISTAVGDWTRALQDGKSKPTQYKGKIVQQVGSNGIVPCDNTQGGQQVEISWTIGRA